MKFTLSRWIVPWVLTHLIPCNHHHNWDSISVLQKVSSHPFVDSLFSPPQAPSNYWSEFYSYDFAFSGWSYQFSSVSQSYPTLWDTMDCSTPGLPVHHQLLELTQTHVHRVGDAIQPSHPLLSSSPPAFNLSQHRGLFHWVSSLHQMAKVLEFQLQHQSFQWIFRTDLL